MNLHGKNELAGIFSLFWSIIDNHAVLRVPRTTPRFGNLLGGFTGLSILSHSWL